MIRLTWITGIALILLGFVYFGATGWIHPTPLIPAFFGLHLVIFGLLAGSQNSKRVKLWIHLAVSVAVLGFVFPGVRAAMAYSHSSSLTVGKRIAAQEEVIMSGVCLIFTGLSVRHFLINRRARLSEPK